MPNGRHLSLRQLSQQPFKRKLIAFLELTIGRRVLLNGVVRKMHERVAQIVD
jgi:hypothetical protein